MIFTRCLSVSVMKHEVHLPGVLDRREELKGIPHKGCKERERGGELREAREMGA